MPFDHFLTAQNPLYPQVLRELAAGQKQSHWMWFIFPQLQGLGSSPMSQKFALPSLGAARLYLQHPTLGPRLRECTQLVLNTTHRSAHAIFDTPDDLKFHSSMTLFALASPPNSPFHQALTKFFHGTQDPKTLALLGRNDDTP